MAMLGDLSRSPETSAKQQSEKEYREHHATTPKPTSIKEPERDLQNRIQGAHGMSETPPSAHHEPSLTSLTINDRKHCTSHRITDATNRIQAP